MAARPPGTWQDRTAWGLLMLAAALLLLPRPTRLRLALPLQTAVLPPLRWTAALRRTVAAGPAENRRLTQLAAELAVENARLRSLTRLAAAAPPATGLTRAAVISRDLYAFERWLVVSAGRADRVRPGSPALAPAGVAGLVTAAGRTQSLVQTLLNPEARLAVLNTRTGVLAVARAGPEGLLAVEYAAADSDFAVGDTLVTAGLGTVFPKGLRVGLVSEVQPSAAALFTAVRARPFVDIRRLEEVFVMLVPETLAARGDEWLANLSPPEVRIPPTDQP